MTPDKSRSDGIPPTAEERAEKIASLFQIDSDQWNHEHLHHILTLVAAEIRQYHTERVSKAISDKLFWTQEDVKQAVEEACAERPFGRCFCLVPNSYVTELCKGCHSRLGYEWEDATIEELKQKAKSEAYEEAAKVAEQFWNGYIHNDLAKAIRALREKV